MERVHDTTSGGYTRLARVNDLDDYKVADNDPDIRGWDVRTAQGLDIGEVDGLIADPATMHVRYIEIEAEGKHLGTDRNDYLLVPIESARLDDDEEIVILGAFPEAGLRGVPRFGRDDLTADHDRKLSEFYALETQRKPEHSRDFFGKRREGREDEAYLTRSEERLDVGTKTVDAGEVDVSKDVTTEHVEKKVPTSHEEVVIERRPATGATETHIENDEIHIPLSKEKVTAEKRTVPVEEVVVSKKTVTDTETVEADLKKEHIEVDRTPDRR